MDVDWVDNLELKRSTKGYILKIRNSPVVSMNGNRQTIVALSLVETEDHALMEGTKEVVELIRLLIEIKHKEPRLTTMFYNNINIKMTKNHVFQYTKTKHIECPYHFI